MFQQKSDTMNIKLPTNCSFELNILLLFQSICYCQSVEIIERFMHCNGVESSIQPLHSMHSSSDRRHSQHEFDEMQACASSQRNCQLRGIRMPAASASVCTGGPASRVRETNNRQMWQIMLVVFGVKYLYTRLFGGLCAECVRFVGGHGIFFPSAQAACARARSWLNTFNMFGARVHAEFCRAPGTWRTFAQHSYLCCVCCVCTIYWLHDIKCIRCQCKTFRLNATSMYSYEYTSS